MEMKQIIKDLTRTTVKKKEKKTVKAKVIQTTNIRRCLKESFYAVRP